MAGPSGPAFPHDPPMNRAARRRAAKAAKRQAKTTPAMRASIVEAHWRDTWHFSDNGLAVRDRHSRRTIAVYLGV